MVGGGGGGGGLQVECLIINDTRNYNSVVYLGFLNIHIMCAGGD